MPETFGHRLRKQREQRQVALNAIAEDTKINASLLEGLERDDVSRWPSGIYRRAFIRSYARAIGLDPEVVVREFMDLHPDPAEIAPTPTGEALDADDAAARSDSAGVFRALLGSRRALTHQPAANETVALGRLVVGERGVSEPGIRMTAAKPSVDLQAAAQVCTNLARTNHTTDAAPLLEAAANVLGARGVVVWAWELEAARLRPVLAHGYSQQLLAQLPELSLDGDNATAAAFRTARPSIVNGNDRTSGAIAVPVISSDGCIGVFAIEFHGGSEGDQSVQAVAAILAAQLAPLIHRARATGAAERRLA